MLGCVAYVLGLGLASVGLGLADTHVGYMGGLQIQHGA